MEYQIPHNDHRHSISASSRLVEFTTGIELVLGQGAYHKGNTIIIAVRIV